MSVKYGDTRYCLYDETYKEEFKTFAFSYGYPIFELRVGDFIDRKRHDDVQIERQISNAVSAYFEQNPQFILDSIRTMFDKYFCNYVTCFYNTHFNSDCNLYFGINDDGMEIGVPFLKGSDMKQIINDIYKERLRIYIKEKRIILLDHLKNEQNIIDVLNEIEISAKKVQPDYIGKVHIKSNRLVKMIKNKTIQYNKTAELINNKKKSYQKYIAIKNGENEKIIKGLKSNFTNFGYWNQIMLVLDINNVDNKIIYNAIYDACYDKFIKSCKDNNDITDILINFVDNINSLNDIFSKVVTSDNINNMNKINHIVRLFNNNIVIEKIINIVKKQKILERSKVDDVKFDNYMKLYNESVEDIINIIMDNNNNIYNRLQDILHSLNHSLDEKVIIYNLESIIKYMIDKYDFYIIKFVMPSPESNNEILYRPVVYDPIAKKLKVKSHYSKSTRGEINGEISCLDKVAS